MWQSLARDESVGSTVCQISHPSNGVRILLIGTQDTVARVQAVGVPAIAAAKVVGPSKHSPSPVTARTCFVICNGPAVVSGNRVGSLVEQTIVMLTIGWTEVGLNHRRRDNPVSLDRDRVTRNSACISQANGKVDAFEQIGLFDVREVSSAANSCQCQRLPGRRPRVLDVLATQS